MSGLHPFDDFQAGEFLPFFLLESIGDVLGEDLKTGDRDVLQSVGSLLGLLDVGGQPDGGVFDHGEPDGEFLDLYEGQPCFIQRSPGVVEGIGRLDRGPVKLYQGDLGPHDAAGLDGDGFFRRNGGSDLLHLGNAHLDVGFLECLIGRAEGLVDLGLDIFGLVDQFHHLVDQDVPLFVHQIKALAGERQRILGFDQIALGRKTVWIHAASRPFRILLLSSVIFIQDLGVDTVELFPRQQVQKGPALVQRLFDGPVFGLQLAYEFLLEGFAEGQVLFVQGRKLVLADDGSQGSGVPHAGVAGKQLVGDALVVFTRKAFPDAVLHQTGEGGKHVDGRIDALAVQHAVKNDLAFRDVACKVRDGVGDIIVGHGQDGDLGDRSGAAFHNARAFIKGGKLAVQIARVAFSGGDLALGGGDLTHCLAVGGDVRQDDQNMHALFKGQVFRRRESDLGSQKTFHHRVVGQVEEHDHMVGGAAVLEGPAEEFRHVVFDAHGGKDNGKLLVGAAPQGGLPYDLGGQLVMGQTVPGKDGQFLAPDEGGQTVDRGDAGVDIVAGIFPRNRIQRKTVDVQGYLGDDLSQPVDGLADPVEGAAQDVFRKADLHGMARKSCMGVAERHVVGALEDLDDGLVLVDLGDAADACLAVVAVELHDLFISRVFYAFQDHEGAVDLAQAQIFYSHNFLLPGQPFLASTSS